ncbi:uncharacterized protein LOC109723851 [Ananas comosus]|uniref:Uncharacterized protein LOC109723851 n=1 Tax=Ananas comosus TaxID=4615 RepID=A0A6P5GH01_ANACO|nr:uncharacterized protein LOC109723851 [Ananas comosus]
METLFEDIFTLEKDKVNLAAHCFEKRARTWWRRVKQDRSPELPPIDWAEFRKLMFAEYFPDSDKRRMREDFRKLKQDRALWVEHGNACEREDREALDKEKGKKRQGGGSGGQSSSRRPPKYPRSQPKGRGAERCVFCGGDHRPGVCEQRRGRCFKCGQAGHQIRDCPQGGTLPAMSTASAPAVPARYALPPPVASTGRAAMPRQPEPARSAPSGRMYAAPVHVEEPSDAGERNVVAGASHSFISRSFARAHDIEYRLGEHVWHVEGPGRSFLVRKRCLACPVQVNDWVMPIDLLVLKKLKEFDVILGMDWLSSDKSEEAGEQRLHGLFGYRCGD